MLRSDRAHDTLLTRAFTRRLARGIRNRWTDEMAARIAELPPFPITGFFTSILERAAVAAGRTDLVSLWGSQAAPNLPHTRAADLMAALTLENPR